MARKPQTASGFVEPARPDSTKRYHPPAYSPDPRTLSDLPAELVTRIANYVHPADSVKFALASRHFYLCIEEYLSAYEQEAWKWRTIHDIEPMEMVETLRLFRQRQDLAWFVRRFEIWKDRKSPDCWTSSALRFSTCQWVKLPGRDSPVSFDYGQTVRNDDHCSEQDLTDVGDFLMKELKLSVDKTNKYIDKLRSGFDQPLKWVLAAMCPRLSTITFINQREEMRDGVNPLELLDDAIRSLHGEYGHGQPWPHFNHIRNIVTGFEHEQIFTHGCFYHPSWREVASLFLLPNIETLLFTMTNFDNNGGTYKWEWDTKSKVKDLIFDVNVGGDAATFDSLMSGVAALRSITGFAWGIPKHDFLQSLAKHQSSSLEMLDLAASRSARSWDPSSIGLLRDFTCLRELKLCMKDLTPGVPYLNSEDEMRSWERWHSEKTVCFNLAEVIPHSIESIDISGEVGRPIPSEALSFVTMLTALVKGKGDGSFTHLRTLCLHGIRYLPDYRNGYNTRPGLGLKSTGLRAAEHFFTAACAAHSVYLHGYDDSSSLPCSACKLAERFQVSAAHGTS